MAPASIRSLLVFLLAVSLGAGMGAGVGVADGAAPGNVTPVGPTDLNTSERLPIEENATIGYPNVSIDPGLATSLAFEQTRSQFEAYRLQEEVIETRGTVRKMNRSAIAIEAIDQERDALYESEAAAYQAFADGEIDAYTLTRRLARIQSRAEAVDRLSVGVRLAVGSIDAPDRQAELNVMRGRLRRVQMDVRTFPGPAGNRLVRWFAGDRSGPGTVMVATSDHGYALATVDRGEYHRQAYVPANRDRTGQAWLRSRDELFADMSQWYPWTFAQATEAVPDLSGNLFWTRLDHPQGSTIAYFDATSERPFRDAHTLRLTELPFREGASETVDDMLINVERTFPGGPARLSVSDAESGAAISGAEIRVTGERIGVTDRGGRLNLIAPASEFQLAVTTNQTTIEITVTHASPASDG